jgi:fumarylpyruvate hydrolase
MSEFAFPAPAIPAVAIEGGGRFPVHRIYCVGRNYADHVREMGSQPTPPFFFMKPPDALVASGAEIPYPPRTANLHYEMELVVAIARAGRNIPAASALEHVFGYAAGNDLTRRDLQGAAKQSGLPWDAGKGFDHSAPVAAIRPAARGHLTQGRIWLEVNGETRQDSNLSLMLTPVPQLIAELSTLYELEPGDLIFTGTPAGVGPVLPGDRLEGGVEGLAVLRNTIAPPAREAGAP